MRKRGIIIIEREKSATEEVDTTTDYYVHPAFTNESSIGYANGDENLNYYGSSLTDSGKRTTSTKYVTIYPHDTTEVSENVNIKSNANYKVNKYIFGDAIRETSTSGTGSISWKGECSDFPTLYYPFSRSGGSLWNYSNAGLFYFDRTNGYNNYDYGFRPVLVAL